MKHLYHYLRSLGYINEEKTERTYKPEDKEEGGKMLSSGHGTNIALMNSQQLLLPTPALHKIKIAEIPVEL